MSAHPFDSVETITPGENDEECRYGNRAYYDWLTATITGATREPVPWIEVELAICLDRIIRAHEAESTGGGKCAECIAREQTGS